MHLTIETLILVAIWKSPSLFQGIFLVTNQKDQSQISLFFRCESGLNSLTILDKEFTPEDYEFTSLQYIDGEVNLKKINSQLENALYLLKYALKETLKKMLTHSQHQRIYTDEIATAQMIRHVEDKLAANKPFHMDYDHIGFSVSIDFIPTEEVGNNAALALLNLQNLKFDKHLH